MAADQPLAGYGLYAHHEPLCAPDAGCGWCDRERARNTPERVALRESLDERRRRTRHYGKRRPRS
jgi:hypothetical protein